MLIFSQAVGSISWAVQKYKKIQQLPKKCSTEEEVSLHVTISASLF